MSLPQLAADRRPTCLHRWAARSSRSRRPSPSRRRSLSCRRRAAKRAPRPAARREAVDPQPPSGSRRLRESTSSADTSICAQALGASLSDWDGDPHFAGYVAEARRRSLSVVDCRHVVDSMSGQREATLSPEISVAPRTSQEIVRIRELQDFLGLRAGSELSLSRLGRRSAVFKLRRRGAAAITRSGGLPLDSRILCRANPFGGKLNWSCDIAGNEEIVRVAGHFDMLSGLER